MSPALPSRSTEIVVAVSLVLLVPLAGCSVTVSLPTTAPADAAGDDGDGPPGTATAYNVTVTNVVDGDTIDVQFADGSTDTVRLLGVDTPETHVEVQPDEFEGIPDTDAGRQWLREWGDEASAFAERELDGARVRIATDAEADRRGGYGRLLAYVYVDGTNFNRWLLTDGYARLYDSSFTKRDEFAVAEATARSEDRGLWGYDGGSALIRPGTVRPSPAIAASAVSSGAPSVQCGVSAV